MVHSSSECDSLSVEISGTPSANAHLHTEGHVGCYLTHGEHSSNPDIGKGKIWDIQTTDGTSQHIHFKGFIFMIEC